MPDPRLSTALDRIERALERLEARPAPDPDLPRRHRALRDAMADAVRGLDRLIEAERA